METDQFSENDPTRAHARWTPMKRPGADWGRIRKEPGAKQWRWPFREMELGDTFHVAAGDKSIEQVRARAHNIGGDFKFSVTQDRDGTIRVQRVAERGVGWAAVSDEVAREIFESRYESDDQRYAPMVDKWGDHTACFEMTGWQALEKEGQSIFTPLRLVGELPDRRCYIWHFAAFETRYAMELMRDGVVMTRVSPTMSQQQWDAQRLQEALS